MGRVDGAAPLPVGFGSLRGGTRLQVAEWRGQWLALVGWQSGAFKCGVRDRCVGVAPVGASVSAVAPDREQHAVLDIAGGRGDSELGVAGAGASQRRVSGDWEAAHGHGLELAETLWTRRRRRRGVRRHELGAGGANEGVCAAQRDRIRTRTCRSRRNVRSGTEAWGAGAVGGPGGPPGVALSGDEGFCYTREELRSLRDHRFTGLPPWSGAQAPAGDGAFRRSAILARLSGLSGPAATERFARHLSQEELRALGALSGKAGRWVAPSDSTLCRVVGHRPGCSLQDVLSWAASSGGSDRQQQPALAADGKRVSAAPSMRRHTDEGVYFEYGDPGDPRRTPAGQPLLPRQGRRDRRSPGAARRRCKCVIILDALHTTRDTERAIVETHGADYLFTVKGNCPDTLTKHRAILRPWNTPPALPLHR